MFTIFKIPVFIPIRLHNAARHFRVVPGGESLARRRVTAAGPRRIAARKPPKPVIIRMGNGRLHVIAVIKCFVFLMSPGRNNFAVSTTARSVTTAVDGKISFRLLTVIRVFANFSRYRCAYNTGGNRPGRMPFAYLPGANIV